MNRNDEEKMDTQTINGKEKITDSFHSYWNDRVLEHFTKANLFVTCCIAAAFLLIGYLAAFSCEVSWLLEAKGDLPFSAYMLCAGFFIMFVASTILIHGLVTGLPWGLFSWSVIIGILSIPELAFVMIMTTQYWGLQSTHGLTELTSYLIRLIINCVTLICVIPTALKWRRESQVLSQLQTLATRLQLQTPPPSVPMTKSESQRSSSRKAGRRSRRVSAYDNPGYIFDETNAHEYYNKVFGSQNEFNASYYGGYYQNGQQIGNVYPQTVITSNSKRAMSLMDLRCTLPGMYNPSKFDEIDGRQQYNIPNNLRPLKPTQYQGNELSKNLENLSQIGSILDPIYSTIQEPQKPSITNISNCTPMKLSRNCVSLENLGGIDKVKNDLSYGNNLLQNYKYPWPIIGYPLSYQQHQQHHQQQHQHQQQLHQSHQNFHNYPPPIFLYNPIPRVALGCGGIGYGGYTNPYVHGANSKQSLGQESDDYRKYRDIAL